MSWPADSLLIARIYQPPTRKVVALDLRQRRPRVDTILDDARFPNLSPDGRLLLFSRISNGELLITPFLSRANLSPVTNAEVIEGRWASMTTVRFRSSFAGAWFDVTVDSSTGRVRTGPRLFFRDTRYEDTPGWSHLAVPNQGMIYVRSSARTTAAFLRVVPNWVEKMKRAVDSVDAR